MESFKAALTNEVFKLYKKKKAIVIIILAFGIIVAVQILNMALRGGLGIMGSSAAGFPFAVLSIFAASILPLFTALAVIDVFTGEMSHDTMKIVVTKPVTRFRIYLAKIVAVGMFILISLLIVMVLSIITTLLFQTPTITFSWIFKVLISYLVTLMPMMTLSIVIAYLANVFKSSSGVFFLSMVLFLLFRAAGIVFTTISGVFITSLLDWYKLWIASSLPLGMILRQTVILLAYILIFLALGYRRFDQKDL